MTFKQEKIQFFDILQYKEGKDDWLGAFINFFTMSSKNHKYVHTAVFLGTHKGFNYKAEAHSSKTFGRVKLLKADHPNIDVFRLKALKGGVNPKQREILLEEVVKYYGKEYDFIGLVGTQRSTLGKFFRWGGLRGSKPILNNDGKVFCSEAIAEICTNASKRKDWIWGKLDIAPKVHDMATSPQSIGHSKSVYKVC